MNGLGMAMMVFKRCKDACLADSIPRNANVGCYLAAIRRFMIQPDRPAADHMEALDKVSAPEQVLFSAI